MRRVLPVLLPLVLLAGCDGVPPPSPTGETAQLRVGFPPHGVVDTIVVNAIERLPLRTAELVAPDGTATPAASITSDAAANRAAGQWDATHQWHDPVTGDSAFAALTMPHIEAGAAMRSQGQLLAIVSTADIALPDPVAYRRDWQHYRVRLSFGTPPAGETREIAAPQPPPTE